MRRSLAGSVPTPKRPLETPRRPHLARIAAISTLALFAACSKLTVENYDQLKTGMPFAEVSKLLGKPARCDEALGLRHCIWGDETRQITASFAADRLVLRTASGID
jgi:hypothetical protein